MKVLSNTIQLTKGAIDWTVSSFKLFEITAFHTGIYELHAVINERAFIFVKTNHLQIKNATYSQGGYGIPYRPKAPPC